MDSDLGRLYFGRDDAEMDSAEGGLLHAGFLRTSAYDAVRRARKHLIIGRKGSGKSAICRMLAADTDPSFATVLVTPDELSADELQRFELQGIPPEMAKGLLWRYLLTTEVAKHLVTHARTAHHKHVPASVDALHRFLVANGELEETRAKFWQIIQKLKTSLSLDAFGVKVSMEIGGGPSEGIRTNNMLDVIDRNVTRAIADLDCQKNHPRLLILIDQLEDVWSNDTDSDKMVIGLLRATREVGARFGRVSCVTFLRSDIYDLLRFPDKDKYHGDELRVDWSRERLLDLVLARAAASLGREISPNQLWQRIFPQTVKGRLSSYFLVSHTLMRPRDVIHLCNLCRDVAEQNGHDRIHEADVEEAVAQYSHWKLQDLSNEYLVNYPFLDALLTMFRDAGYLFARGAFEKRFAVSMGALRHRYPGQEFMFTADLILGILFDIGFLGVHRNGSVIYRRRSEERIEPADDTFSIHPCFRYALRAEPPTPAEPFSTEPFGVYLVSQGGGDGGSGGAGSYLSRLARGTVETRLLRSTYRYVDELRVTLHDSGLPAEILTDLWSSVDRIMRNLSAMRTDRSPDMADVVRHTLEVAEFLGNTSHTLEQSGFADSDKARSFVRRIGEAGQRLRREATGTERS